MDRDGQARALMGDLIERIDASLEGAIRENLGAYLATAVRVAVTYVLGVEKAYARAQLGSAPGREGLQRPRPRQPQPSPDGRPGRAHRRVAGVRDQENLGAYLADVVTHARGGHVR
jgi:hypothetical protein